MRQEETALDNTKRHQSTAGYWFDEDATVWELDKNVAVNVDLVRSALSPELRTGFTATLAFYAETMSSNHTANMAKYTLHILRTTESSRLDAPTFLNFRSGLARESEYYLGAPKGFFLKWHELGYPGIDAEVYELLKSWRLRGNIKGDSVKRLDPTQGPLTDNELRAFNEAAIRLFEKDEIALTELGIALLVSNTGRRPIQITHMKNVDLDGNARNLKGEEVLVVKIPRAKQRADGFRTSFKAFAVGEELWAILDAQRQAAIYSVEASLRRTLEESERLALPLFPDMAALLELQQADLSLTTALESDRLHLRAGCVTDILRKIASVADCRSERTGEILNSNATRFRYSIGTRAAREGLGVMIIAELLDHTDIQNADVYTKNVPENAAILDAHLSELMAPYANAFMGVIVDSENKARRGDDLCSRVRFRENKAGVCGSFGHCGANVPIPCYTCIHFQALLDGPHEAIRGELLAERKRILEVTGDEKLAAVNDRTILAVAQVIQKCQARREELRKQEGIKWGN
jgi:integrase